MSGVLWRLLVSAICTWLTYIILDADFGVNWDKNMHQPMG